jgi:hypothetical protein
VIKSFFCCLGLTAMLTCSLSADPEKSQLAVPDALVPSHAPNAYRILFVGDSITRHGTNPEVLAKLKWDHISGMAASEESKDFAHLLAYRIQEVLPDRKVELYFDGYGNGSIGNSPNVAEKVAPLRGLKPNLVVIQLGEHDGPEEGIELFKEKYQDLVSAFDDLVPRPLVLCSGPWSPSLNGQSGYGGWSGEIQAAMQQICLKKEIPFASVQDLAEDSSCRGWGENPGVQWHPNDKGQAGYAEKLWKAFQVSAASQAGR